ncbi:MAG: FAD-binding protein [Candidatus Bathyarchaeota archaeon]
MSKESKTIEIDVLIVGAGGAGGRAAIEAGRNGANVVLLEKGFMGKSGTTVQAGGRALNPQQNRLNPEARYKFQLGAGCYLNDQDVLWAIIQECPEDNVELANFAKEMNAAPTENWCNALRHELSKYPNVCVMENTIVTRLLTNEGKIVGATALDVRNGGFVLFKAKAVILATGGYGDLYRPSECAPLGINGGVWGDGQALAYHAGAELVEMEMVNQQALPANPKWNLWYRHLYGFRETIPFGPIVDKDGKALPGLSKEEIANQPIGCAPPIGKPAHTYRPLLELLIYKESLKGPVYVPADKAAEEMLHHEIPLTIPDKALHVDPKQIPVMEVVIGPLLGQGGPRINENGETNVLGLYAAGECPGNVYGAYRGNPFMDSILPMGRRSGKTAAEYVKTAKQGPVDLAEVEKEKDRIYGFLKPKQNPISPIDAKKKIWEINGKHLFMIRNAKGLNEAIKEIEEFRKKDLPRIQALDVKCMNLDWVDAIETVFAIDVSEMIARSALFREESRGCQYREDFPQIDNTNWLCHTLLWKDFGTNEMKLSKSPVVMTKFKPPNRIGEAPIPI